MKVLPGEFAYSAAGRDKDNLFIILCVKDGYAYLVDGKVRKVGTPKKKKLKHLKLTGTNDRFISEKLSLSEGLTNKEIKYSISNYKASRGEDKIKL